MSEKWNKYWNALTKQQQGMHGLALANEVIAQLEARLAKLESDWEDLVGKAYEDSEMVKQLKAQVSEYIAEIAGMRDKWTPPDEVAELQAQVEEWQESIDQADWLYVLVTEELREQDDDYKYRWLLGVKMGMRLMLKFLDTNEKGRDGWLTLIETSHQYNLIPQQVLDALLEADD